MRENDFRTEEEELISIYLCKLFLIQCSDVLIHSYSYTAYTHSGVAPECMGILRDHKGGA